MDWNLGNNKIQDIQQPVKYETDSDNESDEDVSLNLNLVGTPKVDWRAEVKKIRVITEWYSL